jgi:starch-binding outer membrane protein, SusD/RagB family
MRTLTTATVLLLALAAAACSRDDILDVNTPDVIDPGALDNPLGVQALYAGAVSEFAFQMDNFFGLALVSALFTDEAMHASTPPAVREWDLRNVLTTNTSTPALFLNLQRARARTADAAARVAAVVGAPDARVGELLAVEAFTWILLAEHYCSGVPVSRAVAGQFEYGPPLSTGQLLDTALVRLDDAAAEAAGDARVINLISVLRARALVNQGDFAGAAAAVAAVPTDYVYQIFHSTTTPRQTNQIPVQFGADIFSMPSGEGTNGMDFATVGDPRVPALNTGLSRNDGVTPMTQYVRYTSQADPVTHASGIEARLIEAENELDQGNTANWLAILNTIRGTVPGLGNLADPGTPEGRVLLMFRERAFWLYLTAHRLGDLRRMVRQYGLDAESVFPTGAYHKQGLTRGTQVAFVVPQPEENNPEFDASACNPLVP